MSNSNKRGGLRPPSASAEQWRASHSSETGARAYLGGGDGLGGGFGDGLQAAPTAGSYASGIGSFHNWLPGRQAGCQRGKAGMGVEDVGTPARTIAFSCR